MQDAAWSSLTAFTVSFLLGWCLIRMRFALDRPNVRSLHDAPVPRVGGIAIHVGIVAAWLAIGSALPVTLWIAYVMLLAVSALDDMRGAPILLRFTVHLFAAALLVAGMMMPQFGAIAMLIAILAVSWMANLYNFMDGADGLAGGMTVFGFSFYGIAALISGQLDFALLNLSIASAAAAFLIFNFYPARIFMGDVGSVPLGFLAGALGLAGFLRGDWAWWFPALVFSPFIIDATVTLTRRLARKERIWVAHRDHYYQRLVQLGWGHRKTAYAEYGLMTGCGIAALAANRQNSAFQAATLAAAALIYAILILAIGRAWRKHVA